MNKQIEFEARRICLRNGVDDPETCRSVAQSIAYRQYLDLIEPWLKLKRDIYSFSMPKITIFLDGDALPKYEYEFSEQQKTTLVQIDNVINAIAKEYFTDSPAPLPEPPTEA